MKPHGSDQGFAATTLKSKFPSLADASLHYLDNAATAQMPEIVLGALRQFELEARADVHEGVHRLGRDAMTAYEQARRRGASFLNASSVCGAALESWSESTHVPSYELIKRPDRSLNDQRPRGRDCGGG
jgi:selenocysteine lyase/cysteine desulfurase